MEEAMGEIIGCIFWLIGAACLGMVLISLGCRMAARRRYLMPLWSNSASQRGANDDQKSSTWQNSSNEPIVYVSC